MNLAALLSITPPQAIPSLALPHGLRILVLAPHPDDFDSIGVTLNLFDQLLDNPENGATILALMQTVSPDIVFLPHGNDTNHAHRAMYSLFNRAARRRGHPLAAFLNRDPKTIGMRADLYMPFGQEGADWKAKLLRFHHSQHQRNLRARGHGFDDRILDVNRTIARDLALPVEYAEAFELELYNLPEQRIAPKGAR